MSPTSKTSQLSDHSNVNNSNSDTTNSKIRTTGATKISHRRVNPTKIFILRGKTTAIPKAILAMANIVLTAKSLTTLKRSAGKE
jgi:hypothetical protein